MVVVTRFDDKVQTVPWSLEHGKRASNLTRTRPIRVVWGLGLGQMYTRKGELDLHNTQDRPVWNRQYQRGQGSMTHHGIVVHDTVSATGQGVSSVQSLPGV